MKPAPFIYHAPQTIEELLADLGKYEDSKLLAGGQTLGALLNFRLVMPSHVIDLNRIPELAYIREADGELLIGAMTRQRTLERADMVRQRCPIMGQALRFVGHFQTRNRGTIGGSLSNWDPSAELAGIAVLHDAELAVRSLRGERRISVADWGQAFMTTALDEDEALVGIRIPTWPDSAGFAFLEVARRFGDFAVAGAMGILTLDVSGKIDRIAVCLIGIHHSPVRLYELEEAAKGAAFSTELASEFGEAARKCVTIEDSSGDTRYRGNVASALVKRVIGNSYQMAVDKAV